MRRSALVALSLVLMAVATASAIPALRALTNGSEAGHVPMFRVERVDFVRQVHAEGNLQAVDATLLGPPAENRQALKIAWLAPDGSLVRKGDVVIRFDPTEMQENLRSGQHDLATADSKITQRETLGQSSRHALGVDAEMASLELDYARNFQTKDSQVFSRVEIIEAEIDEDLAVEKQSHAESVEAIHSDLDRTKLELLAIERRQAEIKIDQARQGLDKLEVRAPHDGIFVLKQRWGGVPEVGQSVWGGQPLAEIPNMERMEARVFVLEADAGGLETGLTATLTVDAHPERVWPARVGKVDALAQRRNRRVPVQYFGVTLELDETDPERMKPGGRVQAVITLDEVEAVVTVPRQAVFEDEGRKIVYRREDGEFNPVEVELGATSLGRVVVEKGLEPGDRIALRDPTRPADLEGESAGETANGPMGTGN